MFELGKVWLTTTSVCLYTLSMYVLFGETNLFLELEEAE